MQYLDPDRTTWHITFGTYGSRLHGDERPTVDKQHNRRGEEFLPANPNRQRREYEAMLFDAVNLTREQCLFAQDKIPAICVRGGWSYRTCSAAPDHVHVLLDIDPAIHGEKARRLIKRWLTQALDEHWPRAKDSSWWAEEGSNKPVKDEEYLNNAFDYIERQRMT